MIADNLPDDTARRAATRERARNVVIDAGAGTGKTEILVRRLVELVAPADDAVAALSIDRVAAVTFTRRAAGELAFRIRQRLLADLSASDVSPARRGRLRTALAGLDAAAVGTIHAFCDRLLRRYPVEARLSASYDIAEDTSLLVDETLDLLLRGVRNGTLAQDLGGYDEILADEAAETLRDFSRCGLRLQTQENEYRNKYGLDALVESFVRTRDVPPALPALEEFRYDDYRGLCLEFLALVDPIAHIPGAGVEWLVQVATRIRRVERVQDPVVLFAEIAAPLARRGVLGRAENRADLGNDDRAWNAWKAILGDNRVNPVRATALRDDLLEPLTSWMASRLVNLQPIVVAAYDVVKRRRRSVDQLDLLLQLRNLLRDRLDVRAELQSVYDHLLVDEFQDTDPLQAEVLMYLCEDGATATRWEEVRPRAGCITVVGDPQQSIYRFRRADIQMYDQVTQRLADAGAARFTLSASLRSDPRLVDWFNARFSEILELPPAPGERFDAATGRAYYQPLTNGRIPAATTPRVHALPIVPADGADRAEDFRRVEAEALAYYLRWLVSEACEERIPVRNGAPRRITYGDIAILAAVTTNVGLLRGPFDEHGIPYVAAGGRLFLQDDLHRRFLLGLRALADRDDGVAEAALLRPPFFAIDASDLMRDRAREDSPEALRAREARDLVRELRRLRFDRSPGETARDLLERTAIGRDVALGANGAQRLAGLRELCLTLERLAAQDGLDYDAATAALREWVSAPAQLDPPAPVEGNTVRILTIHQAKGLEFPVVVMWDCRGTMTMRGASDPPWVLSRDGAAWSLSIDKLSWQEPADGEILPRERLYENTQRERLTYVAATRARDLLVLPCAGHPDETVARAGSATNRRLIEDSPDGSVCVLERFLEDELPTWAVPPVAPAFPMSVPAADDATLEVLWRASLEDAALPRLVPRAVSVVAHESAELDSAHPLIPAPRRPSRFGPDFGTTVHRAIGLSLRDGLSPAESVRRSALAIGLTDHLPEAVADVTRTLATLTAEGLSRRPGTDLRLEYPVAAPNTDATTLLVGTIDLVVVRPDELVILDFKSDAFVDGAMESTYSDYVAQLRSYAELLDPVSSRTRVGLLFTQSGGIRWLSETIA